MSSDITLDRGNEQPPNPPAANPIRKRSGGAPLGNTNALRHGGETLRRRHGVALAKLPGRTGYIANRLTRLRLDLEDAVIATKGRIGPAETLAINSAARCEQLCQYVAMKLRTECDKFDNEQQIALLEKIAKHSIMRDQAVRSLGLDVPFDGTIDAALPPMWNGGDAGTGNQTGQSHQPVASSEPVPPADANATEGETVSP